MATIHSRLVRLENRPDAGRPMMTRAKVEEFNSAMADETYAALVRELCQATCRRDTDPSLQHQAKLAIPDNGPSVEECERRLTTFGGLPLARTGTNGDRNPSR